MTSLDELFLILAAATTSAGSLLVAGYVDCTSKRQDDEE